MSEADFMLQNEKKIYLLQLPESLGISLSVLAFQLSCEWNFEYFIASNIPQVVSIMFLINSNSPIFYS